MTTRLRLLAMILLIVVAWVLTGCAADVVMLDPRTGATATCPASLRGFNPWSQQEACVGEYITAGWRRLDVREGNLAAPPPVPAVECRPWCAP